MTLPAREFPEEDRSRTRLESAAATSPEAPPAASSGSADADKTMQADDAVQADKTVQADDAVQADKTVQADGAALADGAVRADAGMAAFDPPPAFAVSPEAGSSAPDDSVEVAAGKDWHQILAMFVDDPRGSVAEASAMVDQAINAFIAAARGQQASLAASWQAQDTDTEQLRMALRDYRTFWTSMTQLLQPS